MKLDVVNLSGKKAGSIDVSDAIFGLEPRGDILQRMVRYQLAKRQASMHKTLNAPQGSRTGAKFGRQKGGGRARHGDRNAPIFIGWRQCLRPGRAQECP